MGVGNAKFKKLDRGHHFGELLGRFCEVQPHGLASPLEYLPKKNENIRPQQGLHRDGNACLIRNSRNLETPRVHQKENG